MNLSFIYFHTAMNQIPTRHFILCFYSNKRKPETNDVKQKVLRGLRIFQYVKLINILNP